ncbi:hypothetical protein [Caldicellulosiruptor bescii]|uniref:hypothetical protein n=1 Tax=Caldicellulosiruptor bescii TaxID=31899 RepID=UPI0021199105|nr:hypothetical protein [Caldicellulosiruptor bescii]
MILRWKKVIKDFGELDINLFEPFYRPDDKIFEGAIIGTNKINYVSNRLFMWMFSREDVEEFELIFGLLRQPKYGYVRSELKENLYFNATNCSGKEFVLLSRCCMHRKLSIE